MTAIAISSMSEVSWCVPVGI